MNSEPTIEYLYPRIDTYEFSYVSRVVTSFKFCISYVSVK